jgi:hypothetical protein
VVGHVSVFKLESSISFSNECAASNYARSSAGRSATVAGERRWSAGATVKSPATLKRKARRAAWLDGIFNQRSLSKKFDMATAHTLNCRTNKHIGKNWCILKDLAGAVRTKNTLTVDSVLLVLRNRL